MFDFQHAFHTFCRDHDLNLHLSFSMPAGYETANGTFDAESGTVFLNAAALKDAPDYEKAFFLFHELRHALQHLHPEQVHEEVIRSLPYVIQYDGTCYKIIQGRYYACKFADSEECFPDLYLGQPYEVDANTFAYESVRALYGESEGLRRLYTFWMPGHPVSDDRYRAIYARIDEAIHPL